ncbi:MCP four helix bundle domain-containing protein [Patescibacteria group bacterium]|nr:MCP four helix bundle domain-containing protein [Patescibacteria group bacterium]
MRMPKKLKFRQFLKIGFSIIIIFMIVTLVNSLAQTREARKKFKYITEINFVRLKLANSILSSVRESAVATRDILLVTEVPEYNKKATELVADILEGRKEYDESADEMWELVAEEDMIGFGLLKELEESKVSARQKQDAVIELAVMGKTAEAINLLNEEGLPALGQQVDQIENFLLHNEKRVALRSQEEERGSAEAYMRIIALGGSAIILSIIIFILLSTNTTKREQAEEELKKMVEQLKELEKLKDDFLNTTTHELKTPLIPIKSQSEILLAGDYGELNAEQKEAVEMIFRNEELLNQLTGDVLDVTKIKSSKLKLVLEETVLGRIVVEAVRNMEKIAEKSRLKLVLKPLPELPKLSIDPRRMTQVMNNLLNNAIKFTPEKGEVEIMVKKTEKNVEVSVKDTGLGMEKKTLEKLFTPFFQAQSDILRKYGGTGLGLAICKGIIEAHNGKIWAKSDGLGKGSVFTFWLPIK